MRGNNKEEGGEKIQYLSFLIFISIDAIMLQSEIAIGFRQ